MANELFTQSVSNYFIDAIEIISLFKYKTKIVNLINWSYFIGKMPTKYRTTHSGNRIQQRQMCLYAPSSHVVLCIHQKYTKQAKYFWL